MSRFVSGGTVDEPAERDDEWLKAQEEIEAKRRRKEDESRQNDGKSLYEVLQANKAAKQDAFEEAARLSNQFRSLDQDEVEFLDAVLESTRAKEDAVRKETAEQLEAFRRQQEDTEKAVLETAPEASNQAGNDSFAFTARKRKRARDKEILAGVKLRKSSSAGATTTETLPPPDSSNRSPSKPAQNPTNQLEFSKAARSSAPEAEKVASEKIDKTPSQHVKKPQQQVLASPSIPPAPVVLGLAGYSSDED